MEGVDRKLCCLRQRTLLLDRIQFMCRNVRVRNSSAILQLDGKKIADETMLAYRDYQLLKKLIKNAVNLLLIFGIYSSTNEYNINNFLTKFLAVFAGK